MAGWYCVEMLSNALSAWCVRVCAMCRESRRTLRFQMSEQLREFPQPPDSF